MHQQHPYHHNEILAGQKAIYVSIRFGNPTSGDCRNFGICKMEVFKDAITAFRVQKGRALARLTFINNQVQLFFFKSSMTSCTQHMYFKKIYFLIETEKTYHFEEKTINWKPGRYPIKEYPLGFIIHNKTIAFE